MALQSTPHTNRQGELEVEYGIIDELPLVRPFRTPVNAS